jgi:glycosyltransferase involved in cell wall biosynthesis
MKIVFVSTGDPIFDVYTHGGGIQYQISGFSKELVKLGHEIYILKRSDGLEKKEINGINLIGVKTHLRDQMLTRLIFSRNVIEKIKEIKPDVINLSERFSAYFPSKLDVPKVFFTHNSDAFSFYKKFAVEYNKFNYFFFDIKKRIEEDVMRRSARVVALNKGIQDYLHKRGITNTAIIPNCVDITKYQNESYSKYIMYVGRLDKVKGLDYLIKAFYELKDVYQHDLVLIGSGPDEGRLRKMVASMNIENRIKFIPWLDNMKLREYYSKCSVFVLPSLFETFGVVLLEAMASAKPVIASDVMGPRNIVTHGKNGFLFKKGNTQGLKKYLEVLLNDVKLRNRIGENARKTVEENYSFNKISGELLSLYEQLTP